MTRLRNPYLWILVCPLVVFLTLMATGVTPDWISVPVRTMMFGILGYVTARYASRAPRLMVTGNFTPEGRNIVGFGLYLISQMIALAYSVLYITMDRPEWLSNSYYSPAFVCLGLVGLALVASSIPRLPISPFGTPRGLSSFMSLLVALVSMAGLSLISHLPALLKVIGAMWLGILHAV